MLDRELLSVWLKENDGCSCVEDYIENLLQRRPLNSYVTDTVNMLCCARILKSTWLLRSPATSAAFILTLAERLVPMV